MSPKTMSISRRAAFTILAIIIAGAAMMPAPFSSSQGHTASAHEKTATAIPDSGGGLSVKEWQLLLKSL